MPVTLFDFTVIHLDILRLRKTQSALQASPFSCVFIKNVQKLNAVSSKIYVSVLCRYTKKLQSRLNIKYTQSPINIFDGYTFNYK